jgi:hypothetical protein
MVGGNRRQRLRAVCLDAFGLHDLSPEGVRAALEQQAGTCRSLGSFVMMGSSRSISAASISASSKAPRIAATIRSACSSVIWLSGPLYSVQLERRTRRAVRDPNGGE